MIGSISSRTRPANWKDFTGTGAFLGSFAMLGIIALVGQSAIDTWLALLFALVSCSCGALVGFLYGIPRSTPHVAVTAGAHSVVVAGPTGGNVGATVAEQDPPAAQPGAAAANPPNAGTPAQPAGTPPQAAAALAAPVGAGAAAVPVPPPAVTSRTAGPGATPSPPTAPTPGAPSSTNADSNTNLEEIADWLTKILLGAGLTQIARLPDALESMAKKVQPNPGTGAANVVPIVISTWIFFAVLGFFIGYLMTRLFVAGALTRAQIPVSSTQS